MLGNNKIRTIIYPDEKYGVVLTKKMASFFERNFQITQNLL